MRPAFFLLIFNLFTFWGFAQNSPPVPPSDSLRAIQQVDSLLKAVRNFNDKRDFDKSLECAAAAEKMALEHFGPESVPYARCFHHKGLIFYFKMEYPEAERQYLKANTIWEKAPDKAPALYAQTLNNLGNTYSTMEAYEKAESNYRKALVIREKILGKESMDYTWSLLNLGLVFLNVGNYEEAEPILLECLALREKILGRNHPLIAQVLASLGNLYQEIGNFTKAERVFVEAKNIWEQVSGKENPDFAGSLINLSVVYCLANQFDKAELLLLEAKDIFENKIREIYHPFYINCLVNLANLYADTRAYSKAEPIFLEAQAIGEKMLGKEDPYFAKILSNLAELYRKTGSYAKAEPICLEANAIYRRVLGNEHPEYTLNLGLLAAIYWGMGNREKTESLYMEITGLHQAMLKKSVRHLSERELSAYANVFANAQYRTLALAQQSGSKKIAGACFDNALFYKGFLLQAAGQLKRLALSNPMAAEKFGVLRSYERALAAQYAKPMAQQKDIAELEEKAIATEKEIARIVAGYAENVRQVRWQDVKNALKPGEAAIEFVHFRVIFPAVTDSVHYAALLLTPQMEQPLFIPLFEAKTLDSLLKNAGARKADYVNRIYSGTNLYEKIWRPIERELTGVKKVYFAPSGLLHRLNLGAVPISKTAVLADRYLFVQVGSTRQLVIKPSPVPTAANVSVLYGGIQFDMDETAIAKANAGLVMGNIDGTRGEVDFSKTDSVARGGDWTYLSYTEKEVDALQPILGAAKQKTVLLKGYAATEETFKAVKLPRLLHIATHGYFFPDPKTNITSNLTGRNEPVFKMSEHPMIRSGLILAGGNYAWKNGLPFKPGMEDGILTAYEIAEMDLSGTELVVLSACETGLGDIQGNEGVYGLQRAFKIAGAKYLIMSLWQVPDFQTQELMTVFYRYYLAEKMSLPDAFYMAQNEMRKKYEHPYFWAGFVLLE